MNFTQSAATPFINTKEPHQAVSPGPVLPVKKLKEHNSPPREPLSSLSPMPSVPVFFAPILQMITSIRRTIIS